MRWVFFLFFSLLMGLSPLSAMGSFDTSPLEIKEGSLPAGAQVDALFPTQVKEGSLVYIQGQNLGTQPVPFFYGKNKVTEVYSWSPQLIAFRLPGPPQADAQLGLPGAEKFLLTPAQHTFTVRWLLSLDKAKDKTRRSLDHLPSYFIVLEKSLVRFPLIYDKGKNFLYAEAELPLADNPDLLPPQRFSIRADQGEDAVADLLTQLWAQGDPFPLVHEAPAFAQAEKDSRWDAKAARVNVVFP